MSRRYRAAATLAAALLSLSIVGSCASEHIPASEWTGACIDADGDGYGIGCAAGGDCDDSRPDIYTGCTACAKPEPGCACAEGSEPVPCSLAPEPAKSGALVCRDGTRYCRDGLWSGCEGIRSYAALRQVEKIGVQYLGLVGQDAGTCDDPCLPDCWKAVDPLDNVDGGTASNVVSKFGGGITLAGQLVDGGVIGGSPDDVDPEPPCDAATDADCDGIPDWLDPDPSQKQFGSDKSTIFFDLAPGQSKSTTFDIQFALKNADIYFLLDMSSSMEEEKDNLIASLQSGTYLDDPSTPVNEANIDCADRDFNGTPDNENKAKGITGNIACLIRGAQFGVGFFREIPFSSTTPGSYIRYGWPNHEAFEHRQDVTESVAATAGALNLLFPGYYNQNWAESSGVALNAVATGGPMYFGWDRPGIPKKTCAAGRFGYPCFRSEAMPIVVLITDAPIMNGPVPTTQSHLGNFFPGYNVSQPVNYDANGLKHMQVSTDPNYYPVSGNETFASAYDVGVIDTTFKTYTGDTRGMAADIHTGNLGITTTSAWPTNATTAGSPGYPDAVFRFKVTDSNKTLLVSTRGTRFKPTLAILPAPTTLDAAAIGTNHSPATAKDLGSLSGQFVRVLNGDTTPLAFSVSDLPIAAISEAFRGESVANASDTAPDAWFRFTVPADVNGVTFAANGASFDAVLGLYAGIPDPVQTLVSLNTNDKHTTLTSQLPTTLTTTPATLDGRSVLYTLGDTSALTLVADYAANLFTGATTTNCGAVSGTSKDAVIDFRLAAAQTVRIETLGSADVRGAAGFDHALGLFTRPASALTNFAAGRVCNVGGAGTRRSLIETALPAGTYSVVVRGLAAANTGSYGLLLSDATDRPIAWHNERVASSFTANLKTGVTYYLGMRGRSTANGNGRGPYSIRIATALTGSMAYDNTPYATYSDDGGCTGVITRNECKTSLGGAEISAKYPVGEYYAVIKGRAANTAGAPASTGTPTADLGRGWYQITFGDASKVSDQTYVAPTWGVASGTCTSGTCKALADKNIRVITIASTIACSGCEGGSADANKALQEQGDSIAKLTGAKSLAGSALRFDIANNGTGMGNKVVQAIYQLSQGLKQDISVRFVQAPDTPTSPQSFTFLSRAISTPGDGCDGLADREPAGALDNIPDTHTGCAPGAVPRFQITIGNPPYTSPKRVLPNTASGSKGGYNMRIDLMGNGQYVIDSTPVFVVPADVMYSPSKYTYTPQGKYTQDVLSTACTGTARPRWTSLSWSAAIPKSTSVEWRVCAGDTTAQLDACAAATSPSQWQSLSVVSGGTACTQASECIEAAGYCGGNVCEYPLLGGTCLVSSDCGPAGTCTLGKCTWCSANADCGGGGVCSFGQCRWTKNPIDLKPVAKRLEGRSMLRIQALLNSSTDLLSAPTVYDFSLTYVCTPNI